MSILPSFHNRPVNNFSMPGRVSFMVQMIIYVYFYNPNPASRGFHPALTCRCTVERNACSQVDKLGRRRIAQKEPRLCHVCKLDSSNPRLLVTKDLMIARVMAADMRLVVLKMRRVREELSVRVTQDRVQPSLSARTYFVAAFGPFQRRQGCVFLGWSRLLCRIPLVL